MVDAFSDKFILKPREQKCDNFELKLEALPVKYLGGFGAEVSRHWLNVKKYAKITLNSLWKLETSELEKNLQLVVKNEYKPNFELKINSCFLQNSSNLHIGKFAQNFDKMLLKNLYNNVKTENPLVMNNNSGLSVQDSLLAQDFVNIVVTNDRSSKQVFLDWNNKQFFPQLYREIGSKKYFNINLTGSVVYLQKEVVYNIRTIDTLKIGKNVQRIEYGSLATPSEILVNSFIDPDTDQKYFLKSYDKDNFLRGLCAEISLKFVCEICYMHQIGLHKIKDNISFLCEARINPTFPLKKCYWRDVEPIPESLCQFKIDQSRQRDAVSSGVRTCASIPEDVSNFLNSLPKERGICVNSSTLTKAKQTGFKSTLQSLRRAKRSFKNQAVENLNPKINNTKIAQSLESCKQYSQYDESSVNFCTCKGSALTSCDLQIEEKQQQQQQQTNNLHCSLQIKNLDIKNMSYNFTIKINNKQQAQNCSHFSLIIDQSPIEKFGSLAQVAKNPLLNSKIGLLTFRNLPRLSPLELGKFVDNLTKFTTDIRQSGNILNVKLSLTMKMLFQTRYDQNYLDINSFYERFSSITASSLFKPVSFKNPLILKNTEIVHFDGTSFKNPPNFIAFSGNQSQIHWESYNFHPQFYRIVEMNTSYDKSANEIFINGTANYLSKEVFAYSGDVATIGLSSDIQRIEYGSLANEQNFRTNCFKNLSDYQSQNVCLDHSKNDKENFLNGNCAKLSDKFLCEICFMHQFGLHKKDDNVTGLCTSGTSKHQFMVRRCYWRPLQPVPTALKKYRIDVSFIDKTIKQCDYNSEDIREYLKRVRKNESLK